MQSKYKFKFKKKVIKLIPEVLAPEVKQSIMKEFTLETYIDEDTQLKKPELDILKMKYGLVQPILTPSEKFLIDKELRGN